MADDSQDNGSQWDSSFTYDGSSGLSADNGNLNDYSFGDSDNAQDGVGGFTYNYDSNDNKLPDDYYDAPIDSQSEDSIDMEYSPEYSNDPYYNYELAFDLFNDNDDNDDDDPYGALLLNLEGTGQYDPHFLTKLIAAYLWKAIKFVLRIVGIVLWFLMWAVIIAIVMYLFALILSIAIFWAGIGVTGLIGYWSGGDYSMQAVWAEFWGGIIDSMIPDFPEIDWPDNIKEEGEFMEPDKVASYVKGINGNYFHGARLVYVDPERADYDNLVAYADLANSIITKIDDSELKVNIKVPTTEAWLNANNGIVVYDNKEYHKSHYKFDESRYKTEYRDHYDLVRTIVETVHQYDKVDSSVSFDENSNLLDMINNIAHFGFSQDMINDISIKVKEYLMKPSIIGLDDPTATVDIENAVNDHIQQVMNGVTAVQTEKYYMQDIRVEGDNGLKNIPWKNYVSVTFMPKTNMFEGEPFYFFKFAFKISNNKDEQDQTKEVSIHVTNGNETWACDYLGIYWLSSLYGKDDLRWEISSYYPGTLDLSEAKNLYDIAKISNNIGNYLKDENDNNILTYRKDGIRAIFDSEVKFNFAEVEPEFGKIIS